MRLAGVEKVRRSIIALALVVLALGFGLSARGQTDCFYGFKIYARDETGKPIEGGKIELAAINVKLPPYATSLVEPGGIYNVRGLAGSTIKGAFLFRISAEGFETYEKRFSFPVCEIQSYELRPRPQGSAAVATFVRLLRLHGKVFDEEMKPLGNIKVEARAAGGRTYSAYSNAYGYYELDLPRGVADISVTGDRIPETVFEKYKIEENYSVLNVPVCVKCEQKNSKN